MHTWLLNIGFIKQPDGTYYNAEIAIKVTVLDDTHVLVDVPRRGEMTATLKELEAAIVSGGLGDY